MFFQDVFQRLPILKRDSSCLARNLGARGFFMVILKRAFFANVVDSFAIVRFLILVYNLIETSLRDDRSLSKLISEIDEALVSKEL